MVEDNVYLIKNTQFKPIQSRPHLLSILFENKKIEKMVSCIILGISVVHLAIGFLPLHSESNYPSDQNVNPEITNVNILYIYYF